MNNNNNGNNEGFEIDIFRLLQALWKYAALILIVGIIFSAASVLYARTFVTPKYEANALFYVNSKSISLSNSLTITSGDLSMSSALVSTYLAILESRATMEQVLAASGAPYTYETLRSMVSAKAVNSTGLFTITVRSSSPEEARTLANVIADILPDKITDIMSNSAVEVVDYAVTPRTRVSPSYFKYATVGMAVGVLLVAALVILFELLDDVIHDEDYLVKTYNGPLLGTIPDLTARSRKHDYSKYGEYSSSGDKAKAADKSDGDKGGDS